MQITSSYLTQKGQIILPAMVRKILGLQHKGDLVGFVIDNGEIRVVKARIIKDTSMTPDEIALMSKWSRKGKGKVRFKNTKSALKYLWRI